MSSRINPALKAFLAQVADELVWAQLFIRRRESGYEIRHLVDRAHSTEQLRFVPLRDVRELAQFTDAGTFRPLKSAPNLRRGWRTEAHDPDELELILNQFYPGAIADWYTTQLASVPLTNYREFTNRQTGMYRVAVKLSDLQTAQVISACCHESLCLKRRLWTVNGVDTDPPATKSVIPCLEPCAILLELARKAMRLEQEEKVSLALGASELATLMGALERTSAQQKATLCDGDMDRPTNPRRLRLLLEKLRTTIEPNRKPTLE